ncbi:acetyl-CoA carboxylase biotin carboxyl carrier protein [Evansella sp. AB-rgal1]|uniref:acetyl-CoA carboxylase biotin carboxyl carrier protein n=1 Tax=Evansella sp. AB-rgal1 TaxID=3242696 RepID=UPI00359ED712
MLKIQEIRELIKLIDESSIEEFKFEQSGSKVTLRKNVNTKGSSVQQVNVPTAATHATSHVAEPTTVRQEELQSSMEEKVVAEKDTKEHNYHTIKSPMVGTFYSAPSPDSSPYVSIGDKVKEDTVVCIVEAMKLMNEIESELKGEIVEILAENGQLVEYGQELFLVKPE